MGKVSVGYQDGCLAPLFVTEMSVAKAMEMGATTIWFPDHFMGFVPKWMWTPEHAAAAAVIHSGDALFDPVAVMANMAAKFPEAVIGTSVTEPIRRHPMSLAQSFVTLDHLSSGRAILGIGNGLVENTVPYGLPANLRVARLREALEILDLLFLSEGRPVDYAGRFYQLDGAVFDLPLYEGRRPKLFIGAHAPRMLRLTGRFADGWLPGQVVGGAEYKRRLDVIRGSAEDAGRTLDGFTAAQTLLLVLHDSREAALASAMQSLYVAYNALGLPGAVWLECGLSHPLGDDFDGTLSLIPSRVSRETVMQAKSRMTADLLLRQYYFGSPRDVHDQVKQLVDAGCNHFIMANMGGNFTGRGMRDFDDMAELTTLLKSID